MRKWICDNEWLMTPAKMMKRTRAQARKEKKAGAMVPRSSGRWRFMVGIGGGMVSWPSRCEGEGKKSGQRHDSGNEWSGGRGYREVIPPTGAGSASIIDALLEVFLRQGGGAGPLNGPGQAIGRRIRGCRRGCGGGGEDEVWTSGACATRPRLKCYGTPLNGNVIPYPREEENDMVAEVSIKQGASGEMSCRRRGRSDVRLHQTETAPASQCRQRCGSIYGAANRLDKSLGDTSAAAPALTADSASADNAACAIRYRTAKIRVSRPSFFFLAPTRRHFKHDRPDYEIIPPRRAAPKRQTFHLMATRHRGSAAFGSHRQGMLCESSGLRLRPSLSSPKKH